MEYKMEFTKEQIEYIKNLVERLMSDELCAEQYFPGCNASVAGKEEVIKRLDTDLSFYMKQKTSSTKKLIDVESFSKMCEIIKKI